MDTTFSGRELAGTLATLPDIRGHVPANAAGAARTIHRVRYNTRPWLHVQQKSTSCPCRCDMRQLSLWAG